MTFTPTDSSPEDLSKCSPSLPDESPSPIDLSDSHLVEPLENMIEPEQETKLEEMPVEAVSSSNPPVDTPYLCSSLVLQVCPPPHETSSYQPAFDESIDNDHPHEMRRKFSTDTPPSPSSQSKPTIINSISFKFKSIFSRNDSTSLQSTPVISPAVSQPLASDNVLSNSTTTNSANNTTVQPPAVTVQGNNGVAKKPVDSSLVSPPSVLSKQKALKLKTDEENKKIWQKDIFSTWPKSKGTKKLQKVCWDGIPSLVRGEAWKLMIGNSQNATVSLFHINAERAAKQRDERKLYLATVTPMIDINPVQVVKEDPVTAEQVIQRERETKQAQIAMQEATFSSTIGGFYGQMKEYHSNIDTLTLIEKDLHRTMPELNLFGLEGPMGESLRRVLEAFVVYRPDVGYVQGMSYLGAILLLNLDPESAFITFVNILSNDNLVSFYRLDEAGLVSYMNAFDELFKEELPALHAHFDKLGITADLYVYEWFSTVFARSFPLDVAHRIWDNFFCNGQIFLFRAALGYLKMNNDAFLSQGGLPMEIVLPLLCCPPKDLREENFFQSIEKIKITEKQFAMAFAKATNNSQQLI